MRKIYEFLIACIGLTGPLCFFQIKSLTEGMNKRKILNNFRFGEIKR